MEEHFTLCPYYPIKCKKCGLEILRCDEQSHNCKKDFKKILDFELNEVRYLKSKYGANLDVECTNDHEIPIKMKVIIGKHLN